MCNLSLYEVVVLMSYRLMRWSLMFGDLGCRKRLFRSLRVQRLEMFSFSERGPGFGLQDFVMANVTLSWYSGTVVGARQAFLQECEGIYEARDSEGITSLCKGGSSSLQLKRAKASEKEA
ncbi:uncharacterized protein LOC141664409 isoform X7 [Apium graveolens]|uniref:uncharacterized protein LOC141664409 isoform X7 n=1 Tax=Apium graveolens TaxID=4045 RepID=UPI003D7952BC